MGIHRKHLLVDALCPIIHLFRINVCITQRLEICLIRGVCTVDTLEYR